MSTLLKFWKLILITTLLGLCVSTYYVHKTPNQYRVSMFIKLVENKTFNNLDAKNLESYALLSLHLKNPSSFALEDVAACGLKPLPMSIEVLVKMITIKPYKDLNSVIELQISDFFSEESAVSCAQKVFKSIQRHQNKIHQTYISNANKDLYLYRLRMDDIQKLISDNAKIEPSNASFNFAHREELNFLIREVFRLEKYVRDLKDKPVEIIFPLKISEKELLPYKLTILLFGGIAGILLGFITSILIMIYLRLSIHCSSCTLIDNDAVQ